MSEKILAPTTNPLNNALSSITNMKEDFISNLILGFILLLVILMIVYIIYLTKIIKLINYIRE